VSRNARCAVFAGALLLAATLLGGPAEAKKFRYAQGPKASEDTVLSVAQVELEPIVRKRGPRVPATNLQLISMVANVAFDRALDAAPIDSGARVTVAPASEHPLNYVAEHAVLRHLSKRRAIVTLRRAPISDDTLTVHVEAIVDPVLEYQIASARVTYLRLVGWLPGRVKVERQGLVEGRLVLRDPHTARVLWVGDAAYNLVDAFPRQQLPMVEDARQPDLRGPAPTRNVDKLAEPAIVIGIVAGLIALFFQNRP
jgi:hypothetical protein